MPFARDDEESDDTLFADDDEERSAKRRRTEEPTSRYERRLVQLDAMADRYANMLNKIFENFPEWRPRELNNVRLEWDPYAPDDAGAMGNTVYLYGRWVYADNMDTKEAIAHEVGHVFVKYDDLLRKLLGGDEETPYKDERNADLMCALLIGFDNYRAIRIQSEWTEDHGSAQGAINNVRRALDTAVGQQLEATARQLRARYAGEALNKHGAEETRTAGDQPISLAALQGVSSNMNEVETPRLPQLKSGAELVI